MLQKTSKNYRLTHYDIQKDIVNTIVRETSKTIIKDLDNGFFSILVDESRDISVKEKNGPYSSLCEQKRNYYRVIPWYCTCSKYLALSFKYAIECLLCESNLSLSKLRGQGYDGG